MTERSAQAPQRDAASGPSWLALALILIGFPIAAAHLVFLIPAVVQFVGGDRQQWLTFWGIMVALEWTFVALVLIALFLAKRPLREVGLAPPRPVTAIILVILLALAVAAALFLPGPSESALQGADTGALMFLPPADPGLRLFWVFCSLTAAVCEETMFRGVAIGELRRAGLRALVAVLVSCIPFAYFHGGLEQGAIAFGVRFVIGAVFALIYLRVKSIWPVVAIHFAIDASALTATQAW